MAFTVTKIYDSNQYDPRGHGEPAIAVYDVSALASDTYPGNGAGESVDLTTDFREIYNVSAGLFGALPGGGAWPVELLVAAWNRTNLAAGRLHFYVQDGAAGPLVELANGNYPFDFRMRITVVGKPVTDQG